MPAIDIDRDAAHDAAQRELAKPIYPKPSPTQRVHEWVDELLDRLVEKGSSVPGGWFTVTVLLILLVVAVVIAIRVARRTIRTQRGGDYQLFDAGELSASQHRRIAEGFAAEGNWASAIRHRLRAVARGLEETGILNPVPGRTANELARDAAASIPALASELSRAATVFNDVAYGQRTGTPQSYHVIVDLDDHLRFHSGAGRSPETDQQATVDSWASVQ
ncbi:DUF4129 domain-containing protein [Mycobacterium fragae]|uniref:Protein-glutamine gamma-glutamyltransferase-like C-terminal domain-containing protein n=1 Tax=Mycobacterium fragae TaxID=1260918 RepID=A0A1X1V5E7_9MYCO|nr:DUF4129 domain-containing protein [Mycobacterium fragae]MCV7400369.1 DUF4129 domain-containing protein [Mycobacterium fragae]ORV64290.1 hypothetical protein AWC06_07020 [Mycobacterium fragae]